MGDLFDRGGLQQTTGDLSERWGQDGSTMINVYTTSVDDETLITVTAGKRLYVTQIIIHGAVDIDFKDGGVGGDSIWTQTGSSAQEFVVPLLFEDTVYADCSAEATNVRIRGWEE